MNNFVKRLAEARVKSGMTQKELAEKAGCSVSLLYTIEQNSCSNILGPSAKHCVALANALGVSVTWLLTGEDDDYQAGYRAALDQIGGAISKLSERRI